jgi:outer membrane protein assembly factor BamB
MINHHSSNSASGRLHRRPTCCRQLSVALALLCVGSTIAFAAEPATKTTPVIKTDWPGYSGPNGRFRDVSGVKLADDISTAKLVWDSEEQNVGFGKTSSGGFGNAFKEFPHLAPAGFASPIIAQGVLVLAYFKPSGEVLDEAAYAKVNNEQMRHRFAVSADDVVLAIDTATGKTKWKQSFPEGLNIPMGKRGGWGITPAAAKGRVFTIGTTGRVRALELATGKLLWEATIGPAHEALVAARKAALEKKTIADVSSAGQLIVVGDVVLAPDLRAGLIAFDAATGKQLWHLKQMLTSGSNMPVPIKMAGKDYVAVVNREGTLRAIEVATGKVPWTVELKSLHLGNLAATDEHLLVFEPKPGVEGKSPAPCGVLAAYSYNEQGAIRKWVADDTTLFLRKDSGPSLKPVVAANGVIYMIEKANEPERLRRLTLIRETDGAILHKEEGYSDSTLHLWGDKLVSVSDIAHRPRGANAEIWQFYNPDPKNFRKLGGGWHVNGETKFHTATGGYEIPLLDVFADGFLFCRTVQGIRCYDLRAE